MALSLHFCVLRRRHTERARTLNDKTRGWGGGRKEGRDALVLVLRYKKEEEAILHSSAFSRPPPLPALLHTSLSLAQSDGTTQWMSNDLRWGLLNMNSVSNDDSDDSHPVDRERQAQKCGHALFICCLLFFLSEMFSSVLQQYSACLPTNCL